MSTYVLCDVKVFGKCTNVKLVYWIIPAISKTVYTNIIQYVYKHCAKFE